jgi:ParB-like nuclease domain
MPDPACGSARVGPFSRRELFDAGCVPLLVVGISIGSIQRGQRIRPIDEGRVTALMASISQVGLLNPITVCRYPAMRNGHTEDGWKLVAGLHRLVAMERLGHTTIAATVTDLTGPAATIAECDENLYGPNLSSAERALFTRRRKAAYLELHPETAAYVAGAHAANRSMGNASANLAPAFTSDTAAKTGQPERTIQRDAQRGERIPEPILRQIAGTDLDKGVVLDRIAKSESPAQEFAAIKREFQMKQGGDSHRRLGPLVKLTPEEEFAEILMGTPGPRQPSTMIRLFRVCKRNGVIAALNRGPILRVQK